MYVARVTAVLSVGSKVAHLVWWHSHLGYWQVSRSPLSHLPGSSKIVKDDTFSSVLYTSSRCFFMLKLGSKAFKKLVIFRATLPLETLKEHV